MSKDDVIETEGKIIEALPNATFKVQLSNGHVITAYISGKLRSCLPRQLIYCSLKDNSYDQIVL